MIKKIPVSRLRLGMYVHDLGCGWMQHGFLRPRFLLETDAELERIRQLAIGELYIDTDHGADDVPVPARAAPETDDASGRPRPLGRRADPPHTAFAQARRIHQEALGVVSGLMEDARLGRQIDLERANPVVGELVESIFRNQDALLGLTRIRHMDRYTFEHSVNVSVLMVSFARSLDLDRRLVHDIGLGALLHDIGKTRVPTEILNKPGRLTEEEFAVMRGHAAYGRALLSGIAGITPTALAVAAEHHERIDGSGYPDGKAGAAISRYGQMAAIVDVYDAITSDRVYHKGMAPPQALRKLLEWSDRHFDPPLVQSFIRCVGIYPVGTLVRLTSGRLGLVIKSSQDALLQPVVRVFMDARWRAYLTPEDVDLARQKKGASERVESVESPAQWNITAEDLVRLSA